MRIITELSKLKPAYHIWKATQQLPETEGDLLPKKKKDECIKELVEYSKTNPGT
jgi:hypothetical protein